MLLFDIDPKQKIRSHLKRVYVTLMLLTALPGTEKTGIGCDYCLHSFCGRAGYSDCCL